MPAMIDGNWLKTPEERPILIALPDAEIGPIREENEDAILLPRPTTCVEISPNFEVIPAKILFPTSFAEENTLEPTVLRALVRLETKSEA